ncbi:formate dehydrogenase subunit gamma [Caenimonas koreensis]|uniref:formate dehydrogenase subunit gamma n=1 Tax=Caenimonas koreensis TaxID=367474 RepID=UPI002B276605|nr:formate dehydrogenase subunit gamma [Caenimonas koreensis]
MTDTTSLPTSVPTPRQHDVVLATPDELRDRIRQLGKSAAQQNEPHFVAVREIVSRLAAQEGALLPILHEVQHALGFIPKEVVGVIADGLNLSRAEVHGVITYYHHFRSEPAGRHVLEVCRAESCQAMGSEAMWQHACYALGLPAEGGTASGGGITLQPVYCLGLCAMSPAAMLDGKPHARLSVQRIDALIDRAVEA